MLPLKAFFVELANCRSNGNITERAVLQLGDTVDPRQELARRSVNRRALEEVIELLSLKEEVPILLDHMELWNREPAREILKVDLVPGDFYLPLRHDARVPRMRHAHFGRIATGMSVPRGSVTLW
jgi:hypothetical protein